MQEKGHECGLDSHWCLVGYAEVGGIKYLGETQEVYSLI